MADDVHGPRSAEPTKVLSCPITPDGVSGKLDLSGGTAGQGLIALHRGKLARGATPWRWSLAVLGLACFGLGAVGAIVPGMPTTVFLLIGSACLTRSCPQLEAWMLSTRLLRPYAAFIRSTEPMSRKSRFIALGCMWCSIVVSMGLLAAGERLSVPIASVCVGLGLVGTVVILRFRRA